jgi:glycosyltransferase involved in cell wall biosynthesis
LLVSRAGHQINFQVDEEKLELLIKKKAQNPKTFPKFGVLVLTYNASKLIKKTIGRIDPRLEPLIEEIFIFDDNSPDNTFDVAKSELAESPWKSKLNIFKNPKNLRYGGNQKAGYSYAIDKGLDYVIMLHGDGQYAPEYIVDLMVPAVVENYDVVFASRMMRKKDALRGGMPFYKFVGNQVLTRFENMILGTKLYEFHSGYRMYSTSILKKMPINANTNEFHFDTEIIIQCRHLGAPIKEVPIQTFYGDEECNVDGFRYAWDVVKAVIKYRMHQLHLTRIGSYIVNRDFIYTRKLSPYGSHEKMLAQIPKGKENKILCVGDSDGLLYRTLKEKGYVVTVVDSRPLENTLVEESDYIQCIPEKFSSLNFKREFDAILLCDYLPKIVKPREFLEEIKKYIKMEGKLILSVPNIAIWIYRLSLFIGRFNYADRGPLDRNHLRFFTKFSIEQDLLNSGCVVDSIEATSLPFEVVFSSSGKSKFLKLLDGLYYCLASVWHKMFAYQFVLTAKPFHLENASGEGKI